jgi:peptide/nickel transport system permease protein
LSDDRRVKVLSPGQLVLKRFIRNRLAVTGMIVLLIMFVFSFIGGILSPYQQDQKFYREDIQAKDYAGVLYNEEYRYTVGDPVLFKSSVNAQAFKAIIEDKTEFSYNDHDYQMEMLADAYDGFPAQVTIKNCRDCTFNIYPSQIRTVEAEDA